MKSIRSFYKSRGFSDKLYILNFIITWIFVWACFVLTIFSGLLNIPDLNVLSSAITCAFAELGTHTAFIVWKAKVENCRKHKEDTSWIMQN